MSVRRRSALRFDGYARFERESSAGGGAPSAGLPGPSVGRSARPRLPRALPCRPGTARGARADGGPVRTPAPPGRSRRGPDPCGPPPPGAPDPAGGGGRRAGNRTPAAERPRSPGIRAATGPGDRIGYRSGIPAGIRGVIPAGIRSRAPREAHRMRRESECIHPGAAAGEFREDPERCSRRGLPRPERAAGRRRRADGAPPGGPAGMSVGQSAGPGGVVRPFRPGGPGPCRSRRPAVRHRRGRAVHRPAPGSERAGEKSRRAATGTGSDRVYRFAG